MYQLVNKNRLENIYRQCVLDIEKPRGLLIGDLIIILRLGYHFDFGREC